MTRREFVQGSGCAAAALATGVAFAESKEDSYAAFQREIDRVKAAQFGAYLKRGNAADEPAFGRLEKAFDKVLAEVKSAIVTDRPAVWLVYNMGVVVKTAKCCFSVDLMHRRAEEMAPLLDFALITHGHGDHYTEAFYRAMNGAGKTVISNFKDNYGVKDTRTLGGYVRGEKEFEIGDVRIRTALADHNTYLRDFTTVFEISVGDFAIYHTGDCCGIDKLRPKLQKPDLWFVHPRCGLSPAEGARKFNPKLTVIGHLNELGHDKWRWSWQDGLDAKAAVEATGHAAIVPLWGERIS